MSEDTQESGDVASSIKERERSAVARKAKKHVTRALIELEQIGLFRPSSSRVGFLILRAFEQLQSADYLLDSELKAPEPHEVA